MIDSRRMNGARLLRRSVLVVGLLGIACRQIAGIDDREAPGDPTDAGVDASSQLAALGCGKLAGFAENDGDDCRACLATDCCGEVAACDADAECTAATTCIAGCAGSSDADCYEKCDAAHPTARSMAAAALACRVRSCGDPCGEAAACGRPPGSDDACTTCLDQACCSEERAAYGTAAARQVMLCLAACAPGDLDCQEACHLAQPGAGAWSNALISCATSACASTCGAPFGTQCGAERPDGDACVACALTTCCAQLSACDTDPTCFGLESCLAKCHTSVACQNTCFGAVGDHGQALFFALQNCFSHACTSDCQVPSSNRCGVHLSGPSCLECVNQQCCDQAAAFSTNVDGVEYDICQSHCVSTQCLNDCATQHPSGKSLYDASFDCLIDKCGATCFPTNLDAGTD
jgi:hypothetical protein